VENREMNQPKLPLPQRTITMLTVAGADLPRATERIRELGGTVLGFSVKGATYTLKLVLPPGETPAPVEDWTRHE
jgi:hypothetical protein